MPLLTRTVLHGSREVRCRSTALKSETSAKIRSASMPLSQSPASRMRFNRSTPTCITLAPQRRDHEQALLNLAGIPERKKPAFAERSKAGFLFSLEQVFAQNYCTAGVAPTIRNLYQDVPAGYSTSRIWALRSSPGPRLNGTVPLFTSNAALSGPT